MKMVLRLFEPRRAREERLLRESLGYISGRIAQLGEWKEIYTAWLMGAVTALGAAKGGCTTIARAYGRGDLQKQTALIEEFTMSMIRRWYRDYRAQIRTDDRQSHLKHHASTVLGWHDHFTQEAIEDFINLDTQFNFDSDVIEGRVDNSGSYTASIRIEEQILQVRAVRACGVSVKLDLSKIQFPINSYVLHTVVEGTTVLSDPLEYLQFQTALALGQRTWQER